MSDMKLTRLAERLADIALSHCSPESDPNCDFWAKADKGQLTRKFAAELTRPQSVNQKLLEAARQLTNAMETCHECGGQTHIPEQPTHCLDCSAECVNHECAECPTIAGLHLALQMAVKEAEATQ